MYVCGTGVVGGPRRTIYAARCTIFAGRLGRTYEMRTDSRTDARYISWRSNSSKWKCICCDNTKNHTHPSPSFAGFFNTLNWIAKFTNVIIHSLKIMKKLFCSYIFKLYRNCAVPLMSKIESKFDIIVFVFRGIIIRAWLHFSDWIAYECGNLHWRS